MVLYRIVFAWRPWGHFLPPNPLDGTASACILAIMHLLRCHIVNCNKTRLDNEKWSTMARLGMITFSVYLKSTICGKKCIYMSAKCCFSDQQISIEVISILFHTEILAWLLRSWPICHDCLMAATSSLISLLIIKMSWSSCSKLLLYYSHIHTDEYIIDEIGSLTQNW